MPPDDALAGLPPRRTSRFRRVLLVAVAVLLVAVCAPVAWFARGLVRDTLDADTGATSPTAALTEYFSAGPLGGFATDDITFGHVLCAERRDALRAQASGIAADVQRAAANHQVGFLHAELSDDQVTVDGDRATVVTMVSLVFSTGQPGAPFFVGSKHAWRFDLVDDNGWRVCEWPRRSSAARCSTARPPRHR